jgi:hypothetical protein
MPMVPSPVAAGVYLAVKVVGYAAFAHALNRVAGQNVRPYRFASAKTLVGLLGGVAYLFLLLPTFDAAESSDLAIWLGAIPVRLAAWSLVLGLFFGFFRRPGVMLLAVVAGTVWSYVLDGLMSLFYRVLPGMGMPWC